MAVDRSIGLGLSVASHHGGVDPAEAMAIVLARAETAAAADLDHLTVGDQHAVGPDGLYLQGVPTLARMLAHWPADRQAGLLFLLPLWHPVLVAELVGTLASMSSARFIVQTGIGSGRRQFGAMGASLATRGAVTDEAIGIIDRLLRGETVSGDSSALGIPQGVAHRIDGASIGPVPSQPVEWWIGSGAAPAALRRAAQFGDALYLSPSWTAKEVADIAERYRAQCTEFQREPRIVLRRDVYVADDDAKAVEVGDAAVSKGYRGMRREVLVCGDAGRCVDLLAPFVEIGVSDIVARSITVPPSAALRSIELLGVVRSLLRQ